MDKPKPLNPLSEEGPERYRETNYAGMVNMGMRGHTLDQCRNNDYESEIKYRNMRISEAVRLEGDRWRKALYALVQRGAIRPAVADELDAAVYGMRTIRSQGQEAYLHNLPKRE